jgi:hypothetical protein
MTTCSDLRYLPYHASLLHSGTRVPQTWTIGFHGLFLGSFIRAPNMREWKVLLVALVEELPSGQ